MADILAAIRAAKENNARKRGETVAISPTAAVNSNRQGAIGASTGMRLS